MGVFFRGPPNMASVFLFVPMNTTKKQGTLISRRTQRGSRKKQDPKWPPTIGVGRLGHSHNPPIRGISAEGSISRSRVANLPARLGCSVSFPPFFFSFFFSGVGVDHRIFRPSAGIMWLASFLRRREPFFGLVKGDLKDARHFRDPILTHSRFRRKQACHSVRA